MQIHAEIKGLDGVLNRLERLKGGLQDLSPFLSQAGQVVVESSLRNFEVGGRPKWAPLSSVTLLLRGKGRSGFRIHKRDGNKGRVTKAAFDTYIAGAQTLRDTGILMASIGSKSGQGIYKLEKDSITIGTAVKYAAAHQDEEGVKSTKGFIKGKRIPARPFMLLQPEDEARIYDMAVVFVDKRISEAGLNA